jgi:hypothetical protein
LVSAVAAAALIALALIGLARPKTRGR